MGIEIQGTANGVNPGKVATLTFQNQIQAYVLGLSAFYITYTGTDHWVQNFSIRLLPAQTEPADVVGNTLSVQVDAQLQDASGNTVDIPDSVIWPMAVAVTGTVDPNTLMANFNGIGTASPYDVTLPGTSGFSALVSFLSGFDLGYTGGDHQVLGASAKCGINNNQSQGMISGSGNLYDASGNNANIVTVDAGVIASTDPNPGFAIQAVTAQTADPVTVQFPSLPSVSGVCCMISSWQAKYYSVHNLQNFRVGTFGAPTFSGTTVTLPNLFASINDASNNSQDNTQSSASMLVIAIP